MKMVDKPCFECKERHSKCHATCERYAAAKAALEQAKAEKKKDDLYKGYVSGVIRKQRRRKKK